MDSTLQLTIALLTRTPTVLNALLRDLPEEWTHRNEGGESFTPTDVVAHLIDAERANWMPRARLIRESGEQRPFAAFDRRAYVHESQGKPLTQLLDEFAALRAKSLAELQTWSPSPEDLALRGSHPAFGSVTLSELLAAWAGHDLTHLHQIARIMAYQYREALGPWSKYLGVMQCQGHGAK